MPCAPVITSRGVVTPPQSPRCRDAPRSRPLEFRPPPWWPLEEFPERHSGLHRRRRGRNRPILKRPRVRSGEGLPHIKRLLERPAERGIRRAPTPERLAARRAFDSGKVPPFASIQFVLLRRPARLLTEALKGLRNFNYNYLRGVPPCRRPSTRETSRRGSRSKPH